jgi:hypothetical protein
MGRVKAFAEDISVAIGKEGEIDDEVMSVAQKMLKGDAVVLPVDVVREIVPLIQTSSEEDERKKALFLAVLNNVLPQPRPEPEDDVKLDLGLAKDGGWGISG